mgnify:CR=1 FL=1
MSHLLDVNVLLPAIWSGHTHHQAAHDWLEGKAVTVCPLAELGFVRISTGTLKAPMAQTRDLLKKFIEDRQAARIHDDLPALESHPKTSGQVTDYYLAELAMKHGLKLATFDAGIKHPAVELVT